jgi:hypothetical protein
MLLWWDTGVSEVRAASIFKGGVTWNDDRCSMDLWNVGILPQHYIASQHRRPPFQIFVVLCSDFISKFVYAFSELCTWGFKKWQVFSPTCLQEQISLFAYSHFPQFTKPTLLFLPLMVHLSVGLRAQSLSFPTNADVGNTSSWRGA